MKDRTPRRARRHGNRAASQTMRPAEMKRGPVAPHFRPAFIGDWRTPDARDARALRT